MARSRQVDLDDTIEERVPRYIIAGKSDLMNWAKDCEQVGANDSAFLARVQAAYPVQKCALDPAVGQAQAQMVRRLAIIAKGLYEKMGALEAQYNRRPNTLVTLYTPALAPGATVAFSIQPGVGNSYYRLMGQIADDVQCGIFGYTALSIGGQNLVNFSQTTPTAPVANATTWAIYQLKESSFMANVAPWTGQVFDANTPITGTVVNMTVAATGDAITVSSRIMFLTQTDPCAFRWPIEQEAAQAHFMKIQRYSRSLMLGNLYQFGAGDGGIH